eukprot:TRINITY_DN67507_c0_g1_i1.p1 TRINITY_DN67507_c0_g1~~TRINITY_DN67507_c0_g1_i1.p1  ORF type:complete len:171 (+),score=30.48 TRINITY_DN67507_c0_g1_i1:74-586(+)
MDDDDWLTDRPAARPVLSIHGAGDRAVSSQQPAVPPPKLLQRPKNAEDTNRSDKADAPAPKTLKQKEAEYAAARARIFGYGHGNSGNGGGRGNAGRSGQGRGGGRGQVKASNGNTYASADRGRGRGDADDPDYDRNPHRYAPRLAPEAEELSRGNRYIPPTYEAEFPSLG